MDTESCEKLTHRIPTRSGLRKLTDEELELLHTEHELEIVKITGQISVTSNHQWATSAKQAKRILTLHKTWIEREQRGREAEERLALKEKNKAFVKDISESTAAAKAERIRSANEKDMRDIGVFKTVCREVVGDEMYQHIWQLTNQRIGVLTWPHAAAESEPTPDRGSRSQTSPSTTTPNPAPLRDAMGCK